MPLPPEVLAAGRRHAARAGIDEADGISFAAEAWAMHPDMWRLVSLRDCIDQRRRESGRTGPDHRPMAVGAPVEAGCTDGGIGDAEDRIDLARLIGGLPDVDLAAMARHVWLGLPRVGGTAEAARYDLAIRHARRPPPPPKPPDPCPLPRSEREVLALLADGLPRKEIAQRLYLSEHTVKTYIERISRRLDARNTTHAVALCLRAGWL